MKVLVRGPALTRSGYGEHCRFVLRSLRDCEDLDIYLLPVNWGQTTWLWEDTEERQWLDDIIKKTAIYAQQQGQYDASIQVTIPNEWQKIAPINIGVTAGIETTKVAPIWLQKYNEMDRVITISNHSRQTFLNTMYSAVDQRTGREFSLKCEKDIQVVHYPVKKYNKLPDLDLNLSTKFNFLTVAQWGPRKNLHATIEWFVEEFIDNPDVGLIVKTFLKGGSVIDRNHLEKEFTNFLRKYDNRQCKVYFLHGDFTDEEMHALYKHPDVKSLVSLTHGEGFGLPLFEAAYSGLPVIATDWSGHLDFLYKPVENKKGKQKNKAYFAKVDYNLQPIPDHAVWDGVLQKDSMWAYPQQGSFKMKLREVYKDYGRFKSQAIKLQEWIIEEFEQEKQYADLLFKCLSKKAMKVKIEDLPKISIITSVYDGDEFIRPYLEDITRQTIFKDKCELIIINANSPGNEEEVIKEYMQKYPDNIVYEKLDKDPGIYGVWNLGVEKSTGEYLTNANLDDRKSPNSLERHAKELFLSQDVDLVYADMAITDKPNEVWEQNSSAGKRYNFPEYSFENLKMTNMPHAAPMWRKSIHEKYGLFNDNYKSAGDWEMWLRAASQGAKFKKIGSILGLYYFNPKGISTNPDNFSWKQEEEREIFTEYSDKELSDE